MPRSKTKRVRTLPELGRHFSRLFREDEFPHVRWRPTPEGNRVRVDLKGHKRVLAVEPTLRPSRRLLDTGDADDTRLILCPALGEPLAKDLRLAGINHADLNGRLFLNFDEPTLILDRPAGERRFANPTSELDVFALKSTRLLRLLLSRRDALWTQAELTERSGLSRGLVSRLVRSLVADDFLIPVTPATRQQAGTWRLIDHDRLLDGWATADDWHARAEVQQYSVLASNAGALASEVREKLHGDREEDAPAFTQWFAASLRHPYTDSPVVSVYVRRPAEFSLRFARPVSNGGNLWVIVPKDDGVFQETQNVGGFRLVSDVQIYLDLLGVGQRGPEQAEALRKWEGFAR